MPHSRFKERYHNACSGVTKCSCGKTLNYESEKDQKLKVWLHIKVCPNPSKESTKIRNHKKFVMFKEKQAVDNENIRKFHEWGQD